MKRQGMLSATGILLLALIAMMTLHEWEDRVPDLLSTPDTSPLVVAEHITAQSFSETGDLQYDLRAARLTELDGENRTLLTEPEFKLYDPALVWDVQAAEGVVTEKGRTIRLRNQVSARHHGDQSTLLTTEELVYQPNLERLATPGEVTISNSSGSTRADALHAELGKGELELEGRVRSRYDTSSR